MIIFKSDARSWDLIFWSFKYQPRSMILLFPQPTFVEQSLFDMLCVGRWGHVHQQGRHSPSHQEAYCPVKKRDTATIITQTHKCTLWWELAGKQKICYESLLRPYLVWLWRKLWRKSSPAEISAWSGVCLMNWRRADGSSAWGRGNTMVLGPEVSRDMLNSRSWKEAN